jgi:predicted TIM-barrel fold metal-dependent hydrolase
MFGPDRLLVASDHPSVDPQLLVEAVESLKLTEDDQAKIDYANAQRLFGL